MFRNAQVGDRVWDIIYGWGNIISVIKDYPFPIMVEFCNGKRTSYKFNGKYNDTDVNPVLFWDEIKFEIPEKTFDLENELKKLEIVEFKDSKSNFSLFWNHCCNDISYFINRTIQIPFVLYFTEQSINNFMNNIKDKKISKEQFFEAYKKVFG